MSQLPEALIESLRGVPGFDERSFRGVHNNQARITSIRINPKKPFDVAAHFEQAIRIPWTNYGYYLPERPLFAHDPLFHAGCYYVQEASSMFSEAAIRAHADLNQDLSVLDLCAAPGGKSTHLQSLISNDSLLVSNEVIKTRVGRLRENLMKWGATNVVVTNNDASDFRRLPEFFDVMVVDAPCSGSGLFRKDPEAISEWSEEAVELCASRQKRILEDALPSLKPGGLLIYSTCSYSQCENEGVGEMLVEKHGLNSLRVPLPAGAGIQEIQSSAGGYGYRFYPNNVQGEGFFLAAFRKPGEMMPTLPAYNDKIDKIDTKIAEALRTPERFRFINVSDVVLAVPRSIFDRYEIIRKSLYVKAAGVEVGAVAAKDIIPAHALALSEEYTAAFSKIQLSRDEAVTYLRKSDPQLPTEVKGWAAMQFKDHTLGWAKMLPGRLNNYYPKELRILK